MLGGKIGWWRHADRDYLLRGFSLREGWAGGGRCHHSSRLLGFQCVREATSDYWCGLHNSLCWHHWESNRCDGRTDTQVRRANQENGEGDVVTRNP